ncbi:Mps one binder kinase activator-like 4 [Termitomyces sp. J132]|nr:Mps one binder kinase activator-like 4 [Termitomyces sp. J132]
MKAGEWLYLCVAHGTDGNQCCAIDYILHTLDSATALLNTPRAFPSRIQIPQSSHRHFSSLARRLGRIFAHAYFHHREAFEQAEAESSLYARFLALSSKFDLVPSEFLVIPTHPITDLDSDRENENHHDTRAPRLLAAGIDSHMLGEGQWSRRSNAIPVETRTKSTSPPTLDNGRRSESPRKMGRNRTDTMVLHDAYAVAEELAKASPKAPPFEAMEEPMSPMDVEELPHAVKPAVECSEEIGESLPESPILHSPPPPGAWSLLPEPAQETKVPREVSPILTAADHPIVTSKAKPRTTEESAPFPVEVDIAETDLASTVIETTPLVMELKEAIEDNRMEIEEEAKEAQFPEEVVGEEVEEEAKPEAAEFVAVPEPAVQNDIPTEILELPFEARVPASAHEPTIEVTPAEPENSTPASAQAEEECTAAPVQTPQSETAVEIPDETEVVPEKEEVIESASRMEAAAEEKKVEVADTPAEEKVSVPSPATEFDHAPSSSSSL